MILYYDMWPNVSMPHGIKKIIYIRLKCPFLDPINNFQTGSIDFENPK
jgi:hypothetical protein